MSWILVITFCLSRRRRKMYCGHARLCVCLPAAVRPHCCTDPDVIWGRGRGCPLVVQYWADLQSGHGLRCYGNTRHRASTSMYSLIFCVRFLLSEEARSPGRRSNVENAPRRRPITGEPATPTSHTARNFENTPVTRQQRAQTPPSRPFALCRHIAGWTQACN